MIINTGLRTDIPAFFPEWWRNRIREGYVMTRNPFNHKQITHYRLDPDVVDCLGFCTKNPAPLLPYLEEMSAFRQFWMVTMTPYEKDIEPYVPEIEQVMDSFRELSDKVGVESVSWRYDPIFLSEKYDMDFHISQFKKMADYLAGYTDQCIISFIDLYEKTRRNFPGVREVSRLDQIHLIKEFVQIGRQYDITIRTCCEDPGLAEYGADTAGCMTQSVVERAIGCSLEVPKRDGKPREACQCLMGHDVGEYNTCGHGCLYCYANYSRERVEHNLAMHDPTSPLLIGHPEPGDRISNARQSIWRKKEEIEGQISFFDF